MICGIYSITNTANGKRYYGSSVNMELRWRQHKSDLRKGKHKNPHLQAAWNKFGRAVFVFGVAEQLPLECLAAAEQRYLDQNAGGYNIGKFADAPARGQKRSAETRARMSAAMTGRKLTPEHRALLSLRGRGRVVSKKTRAKLSAINSGKKHSDSTKAKLAKRVRFIWADESYRRKTVDAQRAAHRRPEVKANMSAAMRARWSDPTGRIALSMERKARWADPEYRQKMLAIRKAQGQRLRELNLLKKEFENACA